MKLRDRLHIWLSHPLLRGMDVDDPRMTDLRREIIRENTFLQRIYLNWYDTLLTTLPDSPGAVLELGSGGGFLSELLPELITAEIFYNPHIKVVLNGERLPFTNGSLRGIVMTNVLHHIPHPRFFLQEAARCVRSDGVITVIEPWITAWSRQIYTRLHQEPFNLESKTWEFSSSGPLSGANGALPWIMFSRDQDVFKTEFPEWQIETITPFMPFLYLLSGGVSLCCLVPEWSFGFWQMVEKWLNPWAHYLGMFAHITLRRIIPEKYELEIIE